jgi:hypothetical protein
MADPDERSDEHEAASHWFTFERWTREAGSAGDVGGSYSRAAWVPVLGSAAWFVWGEVAERLADRGCVDCSLEELGQPCGLAVEDVSWGLLQLARYGLALPAGETRWQVRTVCPPLHDRFLDAAALSVRALHRRRLRPPGWAAPRGLRWGSGHLLSVGRQGP